MDLEHQPLRAVPYFAHDGKWANKTDAQYLSLGRAQWAKADLSVKVFRYVETRWSRQSEELPVHRAVDLVIFAAVALFGKSDELPANTLEKQGEPLKLRTTGLPIETLRQEFEQDVGCARTRLQKLREILNDLHSCGAL